MLQVHAERCAMSSKAVECDIREMMRNGANSARPNTRVMAALESRVCVDHALSARA